MTGRDKPMTTQTQELEGLTKERVESSDLKYGDNDLFVGPDGTELYFELRGQGPQLTIVNNFFIISPLWRNSTRQLVGRHRLLTYDLRNQGASSPATGPLQFGNHLQDLTNLLDFL